MGLIELHKQINHSQFFCIVFSKRPVIANTSVWHRNGSVICAPLNGEEKLVRNKIANRALYNFADCRNTSTSNRGRRSIQNDFV